MSDQHTHDPYAERRTHKRFFFSAEDGIVARITFPDSSLLPIDAIILNISRGGVGMALAREFYSDMAQGTRMMLGTITISSSGRPRSITPAHPVPMTIRWLVAADYLDHIGFGCEFDSMEDHIYDPIQFFLDEVLPGRFEES